MRMHQALAYLGMIMAIVVGASARADDLDACLKASGEPAEDICARAAAETAEAIRHDRANILGHVERGEALLAKGDIRAAIAEYDVARNLDPRNADIYLARGRADERRLAWVRAVGDLTEAIRLNPQSVSAHLSRGVAHLYLGAFDQAHADLVKANDLDPTYPAAVLWLQIASWRSGRPTDKDRLEALDPAKWPGPIVRLYLGRISPAAALAAADNPDLEKARLQACEADFYVGAYLLQQNQDAQALTRFRRGLGDCPKGWSGWLGAHAELARLKASPGP